MAYIVANCRIASEITAEMRTKCFAAFKEDLPDSWMEILEISQEALLYDTHEPTVAQRARTFNKFTSKVIEIVRSWHSLWGC